MFAISSTTLEASSLAADLQNSAAGALATFEGWVRDHSEGRAILQLEYQAYEALANKEGMRIIDETKRRFDILDAKCVHRVGSLDIGELAVWVGVSAVHRTSAFQACEHIINQVKRRVPIWKKEFYEDGDSGWVNAPESAADPPVPTRTRCAD